MWVDGIQRVVCGVSEQTTCQEVVIALARAIGERRTPERAKAELSRPDQTPCPPFGTAVCLYPSSQRLAGEMAKINSLQAAWTGCLDAGACRALACGQSCLLVAQFQNAAILLARRLCAATFPLRARFEIEPCRSKPSYLRFLLHAFQKEQQADVSSTSALQGVRSSRLREQQGSSSWCPQLFHTQKLDRGGAELCRETPHPTKRGSTGPR